MINFHDVIKESIKEHNRNWPQIPGHPYRTLIIRCSGSGKRHFNLISQQPDFDKDYSYAENPYEAKHQYLINKKESTGLKRFNGSEAFIEYSNDMNDIYKNIEEYNPNKKRKILSVFDDLIADILNPIVTELFIRGGKLKLFSCLYYTILFCCAKKY